MGGGGSPGGKHDLPLATAYPLGVPEASRLEMRREEFFVFFGGYQAVRHAGTAINQGRETAKFGRYGNSFVQTLYNVGIDRDSLG